MLMAYTGGVHLGFDDRETLGQDLAVLLAALLAAYPASPSVRPATTA